MSTTKNVIEQEEREELLDEVNDIILKLNDVLGYLNEGKKLDPTQLGFLKFHNII